MHGYVVWPFGFFLLWPLLTSHGKSFSTAGGIFRPIPASVRPHGISCQSFLVYLPDLRLRVTVAFWTSPSSVSLSAANALYQVSVRQATISLSLLLAYTSRCKPWELLWGSSATTPLVDFHHRLTACPSYRKRQEQFPGNPRDVLPLYKILTSASSFALTHKNRSKI